MLLLEMLSLGRMHRRDRGRDGLLRFECLKGKLGGGLLMVMLRMNGL